MVKGKKFSDSLSAYLTASKYLMHFISNTENLIDWDQVILQCKKAVGNTLTYNSSCFPDTEDFKKLDAIWKDAGYFRDDPSIGWTNYFPGDFDQSVVDTFKSIVNAEPWMVWVSKISPGQMAPWHYDAHQHINKLLELGTPVRYTCYIQDPQHGHVSVVGDSAVYRPAKGSIYQWPSYDAWHCGMNAGLVDKFMFNYWGYKL